MTVVGVCMAKDEEDIIGSVVAHMLGQVDAVIVADNGSSDGTREILSGLDCVLVDDPDPAYWQSAKMTSLARRAGEMGAEWIVPFDADEIWLGAGGNRLAEVLGSLDATVMVAAAELYDHVTSSEDDQAVGDPVARIGWRRDYPAALPKVAVRWDPSLVIEMGNHGASYEGVAPVVSGLLTVRHFPYRSAAQFIRKAANGAAAYAATSLPESFGAHWRGYGRILAESGPEALRDVYETWFHLSSPASHPDVVFDPAPVGIFRPGG